MYRFLPSASRSRAVAVSSALALGVLLLGADASAFCRTTTDRAPADYDAATGGCWAKGVPLFWRNACVGYSIARAASIYISYDDIANAMSTAFTRWTGATCPTDGSGRSRTSIDVRDLGPADCQNVEYISGAANQNVIVFRDTYWKYGKQVLGLTTVVYAPETGEIYNADMEINTLDMQPLATKDPVAPDAYDFASVVTHEAGHFLGMGHSDVTSATMYARYNTGQTSMRYLAPDDVEAICTVYRPDGTRSVLDHKISAAPECDPTPRGGYSPQCQKKPGGCAGTTSSASPVGPDATLAWAAATVGAVVVALRRRRRRGR
jgi:hypothetical protein